MTEQNTETNTSPAVEPEGTDNRATLLRKAYGAATTRLREQYRTEFDALYSQEAEALGVDYKPRPTPEQQAEQQLAELFEKFPHLREKVAAEPSA